MNRTLIEKVKQAGKLTHQEPQDLAEAERLLAEVSEALAREGARSAYVEWSRGVAADYRRDVLEAYRHFRTALSYDPVNPEYVRSLGIALDGMGHQMRGEQGELETAERLALYDALRAAGAARLDDHRTALALARLGDDAERALSVARTLTTLFPELAEGWDALEAVAGEAGDETLAAHARAGRETHAPAEPAPLAPGNPWAN